MMDWPTAVVLTSAILAAPLTAYAVASVLMRPPEHHLSIEHSPESTAAVGYPDERDMGEWDGDEVPFGFAGYLR